MPWTWEEIKTVWLRDGRVASLSPAEIVAAFDRAEAILGRDWIEATRFPSPGVETWGALTTLHIVLVGQHLAALEGVPQAEPLMQRLRENRPDAWAELTTLHLLRSSLALVVELEPAADVKGRERHPDFRIRPPDGDWLYVEVAQPTTSEDHRRVSNVMTELADIVDSAEGEYALEIFLRREPVGGEIDAIRRRAIEFAKLQGRQTEELPDSVGKLLLNYSKPGNLILEDHEETGPRLGKGKVYGEGRQPVRHVIVRVAYSDDRADRFLASEAGQLPTNAPGLVMLGLANAPGGPRHWEPFLRRRLQPTQHTRVSAIALFRGGIEGDERGEHWVPEVKLIRNEHARFALPPWVDGALRRFEPMSREQADVVEEAELSET